jgi:hypothetical protein
VQGDDSFFEKFKALNIKNSKKDSFKNASLGNNSSSLSVKEEHLINMDNFDITDSPKAHQLSNPKENMLRQQNSSFSWVEGIEKENKKENSDFNINNFLKSIDKDKINLSAESVESAERSGSSKNFILKNIILNGNNSPEKSKQNTKTQSSKIQT